MDHKDSEKCQAPAEKKTNVDCADNTETTTVTDRKSTRVRKQPNRFDSEDNCDSLYGANFKCIDDYSLAEDAIVLKVNDRQYCFS